MIYISQKRTISFGCGVIFDVNGTLDQGVGRAGTGVGVQTIFTPGEGKKPNRSNSSLGNFEIIIGEPQSIHKKAVKFK